MEPKPGPSRSGPAARKIRVVVVDDHGVVRLGLSALLGQVQDVEVAGQATSGDEVLPLVERVRPDVVLLDLRLPGRDGVSVCRELRERFPEVRVIILTSFVDRQALVETLMLGARGYVLKNLENEALVAAIRAVAAGGTALDPSLGPLLAEGMLAFSRDGTAHTGWPTDGSRQDRPAPAPLSEQERRILECIARGMTNREIGRALFLSEKTVRNYVSEMLSRHGFRNRAEAAAYAVRAGLVGRDGQVSGTNVPPAS